ncbi:hypothetical protein HELRODRAFT_174911 [Helobdella robusta]|uniref:Poly A polymerase head domain-containing protein n=1 Tax=Helobdella robusta TaxID=6412 RepID=T1F8L8_HELRO|nr:hypothetical protein HELRODRAFT_174911 [Helobdella robusta]ESO01356.1 hypothetical protein HELRODRAFT_174911 [Helobdella robusta]
MTSSLSSSTATPLKKQFKKLDSPEFKSLFTPELDFLAKLFNKNGFEIRIAGGAVRDLILGKVADDIDFATTATPKQMIAMFEKEEIRMINNKGERHGTITCRINDKENFEITTLRFDVETDGRHAEVQFTTDWMLDAQRRDLTINSIFYGRIAKDAESHDADILKAIQSNSAGLASISGERMWLELKKIMMGNHVDSLMRVMNDLNLTVHIFTGFIDELNFDELSHVWKSCKDLNPLPMTLISAMFNSLEQLSTLHARIKMSKDELQLGQFILQHRIDPVFQKTRLQQNGPTYDANASGESKKDMKKMKLENNFLNDDATLHAENTENKILSEGKILSDKQVGDDLAEPKKSAMLIKCEDLLVEEPSNLLKAKSRILELLKYFNLRDALKQFGDWTPPKFPVSGVRLIEVGVPKGPQFSRELSRLKEIWKQSRFTKTEEELLQCVKIKKKIAE